MLKTKLIHPVGSGALVLGALFDSIVLVYTSLLVPGTLSRLKVPCNALSTVPVSQLAWKNSRQLCSGNVD